MRGAWETTTDPCPRCGGETEAEFVNVAVGMQQVTPEHCHACGWTQGDAVEYLIEKRGLYYMPEARGYTGLKSQAGRFTFEDAAEMVGPNGPDGSQDGLRMWAVGDAPDYAPSCCRDVHMKDEAYRQGWADAVRAMAGDKT